MNLLQETTADWKVSTPNHTYIFGTSTMKAIGYIKEGTTLAIRFSKPVTIDRRYRTFTALTAKQAKSFDLSAVL